MAVEVQETRGVAEARSEAPGVRWSAIFAGALVAVGVWLMLYVGGLALGLTALDPNDPGSLKSAGIGTGIWAVIAPLIALFVGGFVTARAGGLLRRHHAGLYGAVVWALTTIVGFWVLAMIVTTLVGGAFRLGGQAVGGVASAAGAAGSAAAEGNVLQSLGLNANDLLAPINRRLQAEGKPTVTANQLEASAKDVVGTAVREGRFDRELLTSSIAENTRLSRQDANELAGQIEQRFNERKGQLAETAQGAQEGALKAASATGKGLLGAFALMILGLISSVLGAIAGAARDTVVVRRREAPVVTPGTPRREVHP